MDDLTFLDAELRNEYAAANAILKVVLPGGKVIHISDTISPLRFLDTCPLLYHAFEFNAQSRLQANIEASSETAVISLARYCYTSSYLASEPDGDSILLLQHAETYKIAEDFDVPELQIMAHGNFLCQIEYACCLPEHPKDLLDTIRFIYQHFASAEARRTHNLVDTLLNYCVAVYLYHKLGESLDFQTAVNEIPAFGQDLCLTNINRNFEDDCAADIIRLPPNPMAQSTKAPTTLASRELPSAMLFDLPRDPAPSDTAAIEQAPFEQATAVGGNNPTVREKRYAMGGRHEIADQSKHTVSPCALSAALLKFTNYDSSDTDDIETGSEYEGRLRKYKRARMVETTARLNSTSLLSEAGPSSRPRIKEESPASVAACEASYWEGAFGLETKTTKVATEGTSPSARRLLFEYGRRNARPAPVLQLDSCDTASTTLPHRPRISPLAPETGNTANSASEDEGFAIVDRAHALGDSTTQTQMSSPELLPMPSLAQETVEDKNLSEDGWMIVDECEH